MVGYRRAWRVSCVALAATLVLNAGEIAAQGDRQAANPGREPFLVDPAWLSGHLGDPSLVILHLGRPADFSEGHIPHARFVSLDQISTPHGQGLMLQMPALEQLKDAFEELGVSDDSRIILYAGAPNGLTQAARAFVTLDYAGLGDRTSILDGGLTAWRDAGFPVTDTVEPPHRGSLSVTPRPVVVDIDWVRANLSNPDVAIVDARTAEYYRGEPERYSRPGHIEGAYSVPFSSVTVPESATFKSAVELRQIFRDAGVPDGSRVVTYCHIGQQASLVYFIARYLGYDTQLYDGSFEEWSAAPNAPVTRGAQR